MVDVAVVDAAVASKQQPQQEEQQEEEQQQQQCAAIKCQTGAFDGRLKSLQLSAGLQCPSATCTGVSMGSHGHTHTYVWHLKCTPINKSANKAINMQKETSEEYAQRGSEEIGGDCCLVCPSW